MSYTSWTKALSSIDEKDKKTILELGLGDGTKTLTESFKKVFSFEVARTDEWYRKTVESLKNTTNWQHKFHLMSEFGLDIADDELIKSGGTIRKVEPIKQYLTALETFIPTMNTTIDVALVDQGFHFRGECVNYFFDVGIPFIITHDTDHGHVYGYDLVKMPDSYIIKDSTITRMYVKLVKIDM